MVTSSPQGEAGGVQEGQHGAGHVGPVAGFMRLAVGRAAGSEAGAVGAGARHFGPVTSPGMQAVHPVTAVHAAAEYNRNEVWVQRP